MKCSDEKAIKIACAHLKISVEEYTQHAEKGEKYCGRCDKWKPIGEFHRNKNARDGLHKICKECNIRHVQEYAENNKDKIAQKMHERYFADVETSRAGSREKNRKYRKESKEKRAACLKRYYEKPEKKKMLARALTEWRRNNPEKYRAQWMAYKEANKYIDFTEEQFHQLFEYYVPDGRCMCCGEIKALETDHIIPVHYKGKTVLDNLQFLCRSCNAKKNKSSTDYRSDGGAFARSLKEMA